VRKIAFDRDMEKAEMSENTRSQLRRQDGIVGGVCGGLGAFFGIDPLWFRLLFLFLMLPGGLPGVLPYLILWVIIPKKY
jgi:phage shock protein C